MQRNLTRILKLTLWHTKEVMAEDAEVEGKGEENVELDHNVPISYQEAVSGCSNSPCKSF